LQAFSLPFRISIFYFQPWNFTVLMPFSCFKCRKLIEYPAGSPVGRRDACPKCGADLHACRNCRFYDPSKHNQCAEAQAEWVRDKDAANFCGYFSPNPILLAQGGRPSSTDNARKGFDALFKG
jgi:hypothetical protein